MLAQTEIGTSINLFNGISPMNLKKQIKYYNRLTKNILKYTNQLFYKTLNNNTTMVTTAIEPIMKFTTNERSTKKIMNERLAVYVSNGPI